MSPYLLPGTVADDRHAMDRIQESEPGKGSDEFSYLFVQDCRLWTLD
jgi:hypothetical protein